MLPARVSRSAATAVPRATASTACYSCLAGSQSHQRRHSSSKVSDPPVNNTSKGAPAAKASDAPREQPASATASKHAKGRQRLAHKRVAAAAAEAKKAVPAEPVDQFAGLPRVPSVQSLTENDRSVANFFAIHRPLALTHSFLPSSTDENFGRIFSSAADHDPWANGNSAERRPEDVVYTLHSTLETIENGASANQDEGVRWEIIHNDSSNQTRHLDGAPRLKSLEELVAQFKPFSAPPPPQAFPEYSEQRMQKKRASSRKAPGQNKPKQKTFTATITVTESTHANGQKTYSASSTPIVESAAQQIRQGGRALTRRERLRNKPALRLISQRTILPARKVPSMGIRGQRVKRMLLISVKRQRRLKMKKHKYKKLMKRTRTLRRRLERN